MSEIGGKRTEGFTRVRIDHLAVDLNHLKKANDSLGHEVGDALIKQMADIIRSVAPVGATACRVGGDEFAILVLGTEGTEDTIDTVGTASTVGMSDAAGLVDRLRGAVAAAGCVSGARLSVAIGSAQCPPHRTVADAFRAADTAVYVDKRAGRSTPSAAIPASGVRIADQFGALQD